MEMMMLIVVIMLSMMLMTGRMKQQHWKTKLMFWSLCPWREEEEKGRYTEFYMYIERNDVNLLLEIAEVDLNRNKQKKMIAC